MRRLDRYIFREILTPGLIALVALTFIVFSRKVGVLLEIIFRYTPTNSELWAVVVTLLPTVLAFTIPMAVLVGILTGFSRISSDSEVIALRASGVSMWRILRPVLIFAVLAVAVTFTLSVWIAPKTLANVRALQADLVRRHPTPDIRPQIFYEAPGQPWLLFVNDSVVRQSRGLSMHGILLVDKENPDKPNLTFAEAGYLGLSEDSTRILLTLHNSRNHQVEPENANRYEILSEPGENTLSLKLEPPAAPGSIPIEEIPTEELWNRIQSGTADNAVRAQFHQRLALPFACLAFALMALPLGVSTHRGGRSMGIVLSLILMFAYFLAFFGGARAANAGSFPPLLGAWMPNIVFAGLGLFLLARADRNHQNRVLAFVTGVVEGISNVLSSFKIQGRQSSHRAYSMTFRFQLFRLLDMYVLRRFCFFLAIVLGVLSSLFIIVTLFEHLPYILENKTPVGTVILYFMFLLPQIFYYVIPLAALLAILINLGTLTKSNEVLAVKAGAISLYRMSLPLILMGALLSGSVYLMQDHVLPWTNKKQDEYHDLIRKGAPQTHSDPSRKWMMGSDNRLYNYNFFDSATNTFANISILKIDPKTFQLTEWFYAKRGTWTGSGWNFEGGWSRKISEHRVERAEFAQKTLTDIDPPSYFTKEVHEADQMNYKELESYVADLKRSGLDVSGLTVALYRKLSFPLVSFIMVLIGIPFSFKTGRKGAFYGIGFCLAVGILYWLSFELFAKLGGINQMSPFVAAWFPNFIFGASGLWLMLRVKT